AVKGNLSGGQKQLQAAISKVVLNTPYGKIRLDKNRQGIINAFYYQLYLKDGKLAVKTVGEVPNVDQTFGGSYSTSTPAPGRAILGPNGAGKTTLFNVISGDFPPTAGTIEFLGSDVTALPPRARAKLGMGRTYQKSRLFLGLSVEDNLYLAVLGVRPGHLRPV